MTTTPEAVEHPEPLGAPPAPAPGERDRPTSTRRPSLKRKGWWRRPDLLAKATTPEMLAAAWSRVRRNAGVAGADGVSCTAFEREARIRLARLRRDLVVGRYVPGPIRRVEIVKESGGTRPLAIPCVHDRIVQTAVALTLGSLLEPVMSEASFGYRPGLGVGDAVARIVELRRDSRGWVLESDVARFFETIPHPPLLDLIETRTDDPRLTELVALWLAQSSEAGRGLLQGSPLSPLLANLYLDEIDHPLDAPEARLVRYADDFVVLARRKAEAETARERAEALLGERGLALHPEKTRIACFEDGFWFLGHYFIRNLLVLRDLEHAPEAAPPRLGGRCAGRNGPDGACPQAPEAPRTRTRLRGVAEDVRPEGRAGRSRPGGCPLTLVRTRWAVVPVARVV